MLMVSTSVQLYCASFCLLAAMFCLMAISLSSICGLCAMDTTPEKRTSAARPAATWQMFFDLVIMFSSLTHESFCFRRAAWRGANKLGLDLVIESDNSFHSRRRRAATGEIASLTRKFGIAVVNSRLYKLPRTAHMIR